MMLEVISIRCSVTLVMGNRFAELLELSNLVVGLHE